MIIVFWQLKGFDMKIHVAFVIFILKNEMKIQETQSLNLKSYKRVEPPEACFGLFDIVPIFLGFKGL